MSKKIFVALSKDHARVWVNGLEPDSRPVVVQEESVSAEYRTILNKFFNGRDRTTLAPAFKSKLYSLVKDADEIYFAGAGKGKASAVGNFVTHLRKYHPKVAERVRRIEKLDLENLTEPEILAAGRKMFLRP